MKKTYIIPKAYIVEVDCKCGLLQASEKNESGSDGVQLVKENVFDFDSSSDDSYNVWDDDWDD